MFNSDNGSYNKYNLANNMILDMTSDSGQESKKLLAERLVK